MGPGITMTRGAGPPPPCCPQAPPMRRLQWSKRGKRPRGSSAAHARAWEHTPGKGRQRPTTDPEGTAHGTPRTHWLSGNCFWDCQARPHHRGRLLTVPTAHHRTLPCHAAFGTRMPTATLALPPPKERARAHPASVHLLWEQHVPESICASGWVPGQRRPRRVQRTQPHKK